MGSKEIGAARRAIRRWRARRMPCRRHRRLARRRAPHRAPGRRGYDISGIGDSESNDPSDGDALRASSQK
ncbi:hypothetical protein B7760_03458 [Burkholderia glumae]|nr:hypothetical protein B7760_03458 [Burkholderia glumae]